MSNKQQTNWLDAMCVETRTIEDGEVVVGTIISANAYESRILINVADENGQLISQVASFNCATENGLKLARQFFGQLCGEMSLRDALVAAKNKSVKITGRANDNYINIVLNVPTRPTVTVNESEEPAI